MIKVLDSFLSLPVIVVVKSFPDGCHIHGLLDNLKVIWKIQLDGVDGKVERPGVLVLPHGLHDAVLEDGQLVGVPPLASCWRMDWGLPLAVDWCHLHKYLG